MKNGTFRASVKCAAKGLGFAVKTEKNYKYYILILLLSLAANLAAGVEMWGYLCQIVTAAGVFSAECLNTGIEHIMDREGGAADSETGIIKDLGAAGVLCWGIAFFGCEALALLEAAGIL